LVLCQNEQRSVPPGHRHILYQLAFEKDDLQQVYHAREDR